MHQNFQWKKEVKSHVLVSPNLSGNRMGNLMYEIDYKGESSVCIFTLVINNEGKVPKSPRVLITD